MTYPDFHAGAELYLGSDRQTAIAQGPRPFRTAAHAIRFALEEAAPVSLHGAQITIGDQTFSGVELAWLYRSPAYPFARKGQRRRPSQPSAAQIHRRISTMQDFNYNAAAELFPSRRFAKSPVSHYRRFAKASDAIQHCIEKMPAEALAGSFLEVNEQRFEGKAIRALYDAPGYPRKAA